MSWIDTLVRVENGEEQSVAAGLADPLTAGSSVRATSDRAESRLSELYVATNLESWETNRPESDQDQICERCGYRRLDPTYYAWLRAMMVRAREAHERAQLSDEEYELLRIRFSAMHGWAQARFGEEVLRAAVAEGVPGGYRPPVIWFPDDEREPAPVPQHVYPTESDWPFTEPVTPDAVAKVDEIREQAQPAGWSEAALYQNRGRYRFPVGGEYGLVCFLHSGARIGEVTKQWIEIINLRDTRLRFYRRRASMPIARGA